MEIVVLNNTNLYPFPENDFGGEFHTNSVL